MMRNRTFKTRGRAVLWCGCFVLAAGRLASAQVAENAARPAVPLVAGACAHVSDGDILSFVWDPAFDHASAVTGVSDFELAFSRADRENRSPRAAPAFRLFAVRRPHGDQTQITVGPNGSFEIHFAIHLRDVESGTYELVSARAEASLEPGYDGERPQMTHSPLQSNFCLDVAPPPAGRRHRP